MSNTVKITIQPAGKTYSLLRGTPLKDLLFDKGLEFPCGGRGVCHRCKVKILNGSNNPTAEDQKAFSKMELAEGWRLGCQCVADNDMELELLSCESIILVDDTSLKFEPRNGTAIAIDLGTTTVAAQWLDLESGKLLGTATALNPQARYGSDIMSRIDSAINHNKGAELTRLIRSCLGDLILDLLKKNGASQKPSFILIVGNTVMHHLFCGFDVTALGFYPFQSKHLAGWHFTTEEVGWNFLGPDVNGYFMPCIGGFVGSDILAGIIATELHKTTHPAILIDLGTNGEIVLHANQKLFCLSTAAGPAFEGAKISMGMRAEAGAISKVRFKNDKFETEVIGGGKPRGICGSGLVDAVACALEHGLIKHNGKLNCLADHIEIQDHIRISQKDIRELQLAKSAIATGIEIILKQNALDYPDIKEVWLAGAFGNYIDKQSAKKIGLLKFDLEVIKYGGNTALLGAKICLMKWPEVLEEINQILKISEHLSLGEHPQFQSTFLNQIQF
jgi:uncharacterized 2Fe-2S/4Fe-4S cluster protein (DUF4445 family)